MPVEEPLPEPCPPAAPPINPEELIELREVLDTDAFVASLIAESPAEASTAPDKGEPVEPPDAVVDESAPDGSPESAA